MKLSFITRYSIYLSNLANKISQVKEPKTVIAFLIATLNTAYTFRPFTQDVEKILYVEAKRLYDDIMKEGTTNEN